MNIHKEYFKKQFTSRPLVLRNTGLFVSKNVNHNPITFFVVIVVNIVVVIVVVVVVVVVIVNVVVALACS